MELDPQLVDPICEGSIVQVDYESCLSILQLENIKIWSTSYSFSPEICFLRQIFLPLQICCPHQIFSHKIFFHHRFVFHLRFVFHIIFLHINFFHIIFFTSDLFSSSDFFPPQICFPRQIYFSHQIFPPQIFFHLRSVPTQPSQILQCPLPGLRFQSSLWENFNFYFQRLFLSFQGKLKPGPQPIRWRTLGFQKTDHRRVPIHWLQQLGGRTLGKREKT